MAGELAALDPKELVLVVIALGGLIPVAIQYRTQSRWFTLGYVLLVVAAVSTNLEALLLGDLLNVVEHGAGLMGAALAFGVAAYKRRQNVLQSDEGVVADG